MKQVVEMFAGAPVASIRPAGQDRRHLRMHLALACEYDE
jgi:hypothetical protein